MSSRWFSRRLSLAPCPAPILKLYPSLPSPATSSPRYHPLQHSRQCAQRRRADREPQGASGGDEHRVQERYAGDQAHDGGGDGTAQLVPQEAQRVQDPEREHQTARCTSPATAIAAVAYTNTRHNPMTSGLSGLCL
jgi:hypothetical protein